jgi:hypothetical protein
MSNDGGVCLHELPRDTCGLCAPRERRRTTASGADDVYVTEAGGSYHDTDDCGALTGGQHGAQSQAMKVRPIEAVSLDEALRRNKKRCDSCQPRR